jgi:L-malate glycosyltransferase
MSAVSSPAVLHLVWNLIRGGTEGQCARVAMELARRGGTHRVGVFRREGFFLVPVEAACGPIRHVDIRRLCSWHTIREVRELARFIRAERFNLVHCWDADAAIFGSLAARWAGVPHITSRRDMGQIYPAHKLYLMNRADRSAKAVVINAEAIRHTLNGLAADKVHVIMNLLDMDEFDALAARPFPLRETLTKGTQIGLVARLDPEKDIGTFLRAAATLQARYKDLSFVIAGDGVERPGLEQLANELGLRERIVFLGDVTDVPALLRELHIGVLTPARNEGLSNTILEYMAASLPTVATDCGGNAELVRDGETGYLVPVGDATALADMLARLVDDSKRAAQMGVAARRHIERLHRPEVVAQQFADLYASALR